MIGLVLAIVAALSGPFILLRRGEPFSALDPSERIAVATLVSLAALGWLPSVLGAAGMSLALALIVAPILVLLGAVAAGFAGKASIEWPRDLRLWAVLGVFGLVPLVKSLSPSDMLDWDTLAYHFAVPKLWLEADQFVHVPFIHQSNFPFLADNLFLYGLAAGVEPAAKGVTTLFWLLGGLWVFGVVNRHFSAVPAIWAVAAFVGSPVVLWSSGSGYIDVAHGLYAAIGAFYAFEALAARDGGLFRACLSGLGLGAAMGSKYTGLQVALLTLVIVVVLLVCGRKQTENWKFVGLAGVIALVIACPWYLRNIANTGNPVFPFFYEQLGGRGWDQWRAQIYRHEQQTFGVGQAERGRDPLAIGHAALGLGYQPGRYINPGQTEGLGVPMGATGVVLLLAPLAWIAFGRRQLPWTPIVVLTALSLVLFFFLSQQVRYLASLWPLWALLVGAALAQFPTMPRAALLVIGGQAAYSWGLLHTTQTQAQLPVALGLQDRQSYQETVVPFAQFAPAIDRKVGPNGQVALFHEVFGYFLNVPYIWGNPGHSMIIPYERLATGQQWVEAMQDAGMTHVYLRLSPLSQREREWLAGALNGYSPPRDQALEADKDLNLKWMRLLCDALAERRMEVQVAFVPRGANNPTALLLKFVPNG